MKGFRFNRQSCLLTPDPDLPATASLHSKAGFCLMKKIPTTIITGFLGAGKTTLIRHMLEKVNGPRIALIINEFGDLGIDGEILRSCGLENCDERGIVELNNGCICCTVAEEFAPAIEDILSRSPPPDHIVIETSGLALPQPLVRAFNWPEIRSRVTVDGVIVVVDGPALQSGQFVADQDAVKRQRETDPNLDHETPLSELFADQLACGDLIILNKTDLIADAETSLLVQRLIDSTRDGVQILKSKMGQIDPAILLGLGIGAEDDLEVRHEIHHHHRADEEISDHDHDAFESWVVHLPPFSDASKFKSAIGRVLRNNRILRVKGFGAIQGKPRRLVMQAVGSRVECYYDQHFGADEEFATRLVFIAEAGADQAGINKQLQMLAA